MIWVSLRARDGSRVMRTWLWIVEHINEDLPPTLPRLNDVVDTLALVVVVKVRELLV